MIADGLFGQFSPSGLYFACGGLRATIARVTVVGGQILLEDITDVGEGAAPAWFNPAGSPTDQLLCYNRAETLRTVNTPPPFVAADYTAVPGGLNSYGAGGGVWAGFNAFGQVQFSDGTRLAGRMPVPAGPAVDQLGRTVYLDNTQTRLSLRTAAGAVSVVDNFGGPIERPHLVSQAIVWQRFTGGILQTYGNRGFGIERLQASSVAEVWSVPIETPGGLWVLSHDNAGRMFLRAWGRAEVTTVATGFTNYPHAIYDSGNGGFLTTWGDISGVLQLAFVAVDVLAVPGPGTPNPIPGGGGSGSGPGGSTAPSTRDLTVTPSRRFTPARRPIYPHVKEVTDPAASQSLKLLWDRMHALGERLDTGDIAQRFAGLDQTLTDTQSQIARQAQQLTQNPAEANATQIPGGVGEPGGEPPGVPGDPDPPGPGTGTCADSPGTGHFDPGGPLTVERARKISCGTGDEWSALRVATATSAERDSNMELLLLRIIWHLNQGGFSAGRQRNPSTAISKDKLTVVIGTETRAFDVFIDASSFSKPLVMQWFETFPADMVADAGIAD